MEFIEILKLIKIVYDGCQNYFGLKATKEIKNQFDSIKSQIDTAQHMVGQKKSEGEIKLKINQIKESLNQVIEHLDKNSREELNNYIASEMAKIQNIKDAFENSKRETLDLPESMVPRIGEIIEVQEKHSFSNAKTEIQDHTINAERYQILSILGEGGMGKVYKVFDKQLQRIIALKIIKPTSSSVGSRFIVETRATAKLDHPNIVPLYELYQEGGLFYFTMKYVEGKRLCELEHSLCTRKKIKLAIKVCKAIEYVQEHHIIHRDLKPENIIINNSGEPIIMDFGLARFIEQNFNLTNSQQVLGTPLYMAPEQISKEEVTFKSDVYGLGGILYYLATGRAPFQGSTSLSSLHYQILHSVPEKPSNINTSLPEELDKICLKALAKDPHKRYSIKELVEDLEKLEVNIQTEKFVSLEQKQNLEEITTQKRAYKFQTILFFLFIFVSSIFFVGQVDFSPVNSIRNRIYKDLKLQVNIEWKTNKNSSWAMLNGNIALREGNRFRFTIIPPQRIHLLVIFVGSMGKKEILFNGSLDKKIMLPKFGDDGTEYDGYEIDENPGYEKIFFIYSLKKLKSQDSYLGSVEDLIKSGGQNSVTTLDSGEYATWYKLLHK